MKKQIIVGIAGLLAAALLFTAYAVFFKDSGIEEVGDPFYTLTDEVKNALSEIDEDTVIKLSGYNGDEEEWEMIYRFSEAIAATDRDISLEAEDIDSFVLLTSESVRINGKITFPDVDNAERHTGAFNIECL